MTTILPGLLNKQVEVVFNEEDGQLYASYNGKMWLFMELPKNVLQPFIDDFVSDQKAIDKMVETGVEMFSDQFYLYVKCKYGGANGTPDLCEEGKLTSEVWNCKCNGNCCLQSVLHKKIDLEVGHITEREIQIIQEVVTGEPDKIIADKLHISPHSMNNHMANIRKKTGCTNKVTLTVYAAKMGIV